MPVIATAPVIDFRALLPLECVRAGVLAHSKKAVLERASLCLAARHHVVDVRQLLDGLLRRERLGSTGLGAGVAIPHCRFERCRVPVACLLRTETAVEFDAPDDRAVDLLFVLAVPTREARAHLEILGVLARVFDNPANVDALRAAGDDQALFNAVQRQIDHAQQA